MPPAVASDAVPCIVSAVTVCQRTLPVTASIAVNVPCVGPAGTWYPPCHFVPTWNGAGLSVNLIGCTWPATYSNPLSGEYDSGVQLLPPPMPGMINVPASVG